MRLVNTILRIRNGAFTIKIICSVLTLSIASTTFAQENSPYSRYGIGNLLPNTNIINRGMGGISAAYADRLSVNFSNPASYANFQTILEARSKAPMYGRVIFDVGLNSESKTLREPNQPGKFSATNGNFSYVQLGIPLRNNWGLSFGLRPVSRIGYKIQRLERLTDGATGALLDSAITEFNGNGGTFLPTIGTGFAIKNFSLGANMGYLFGRKEFNTRRAFLNDTVQYYNSNHSTNASFGDLFFNAGAQYRIKLSGTSSLTLGVSGNLQQDISASQDVLREVYTTPTDTVYAQKDVRGSIIYPASYTGGAVYEKLVGNNGSFLLGADYVQSKWSDFRYFGAIDSVQDNWQVKVGGHYRPDAKAGSGYFSNVTYRAGFFMGPDYIRLQNKIPQFGITFGMGLPIANYNRLSPGQYTLLNLALEYEQRGNNDNPLKENMFRISLGLNFSDLWFTKRKYD